MEQNRTQNAPWIWVAGVGIAAAALGYFIGTGSKSSDKASVSTNDSTQVGESFEQFRLQFFDDPQFQKERTQFPLIDIGYSDDDARDTIYTKAENFNPVAIVGDHDGQGNAYRVETYDNFDMKPHESDSMVISVLSFIEGNKNYYFKRNSGKWFLVAKEENNNI